MSHARSFPKARVGKTISIALGLVGSAVWITAAASATEYYSWIDPSGTTVITDDSSRIPPATERSSVSVHHFQDRAASPASPQGAMQASAPSVSQAGQNQDRGPQYTASELTPLDPADGDLPDVLLNQPEDPMLSSYVWVPLQTPLFFGARSVSGFWWRSGVGSPLAAFNAYLHKRMRHGSRNHWSRSGQRMTVFPNGNAISSGNPVYDQVMRERQSLQQAVAHNAFHPARSIGSALCCGQGRASLSGRSAVR